MDVSRENERMKEKYVGLTAIQIIGRYESGLLKKANKVMEIV